MDDYKVYLKEDFNIESGGLDYENETLDEFLESIDKLHEKILLHDKINQYLNECGIMSITKDEYDLYCENYYLYTTLPF